MYDPVIADLNDYLAACEMAEQIQQEAIALLETAEYEIESVQDHRYKTGLYRNVWIYVDGYEVANGHNDNFKDALAEARELAIPKLCELLTLGKIGGEY